MITSNRCPDCGKTHNGNLLRCTCGWIQMVDPEESASRFQCVYIDVKGRCAKEGSASFKYPEVRWYCSPHLREVIKNGSLYSK